MAKPTPMLPDWLPSLLEPALAMAT